MRSADRTGSLYSHGDVQASGDTMGVLREAVDHRKPLWIGYVDAEGGTTHRMIEPVAMSGGALVAYDRLRGAVRNFVLHRITGVRAVTDEENGNSPSGHRDGGRLDGGHRDSWQRDGDGRRS
jgi:predicted DNA-binding transcriptional regulator YafY